MRLKSGDFAGARRVADSALAANRSVSDANWEAIARLAGLTGKRARLAEALQFFWPKYEQLEDLHQSVSRAAAEALANAALGICDARPPVIERRLGDLIRVHANPDRQALVADRVAGTVLSFTVPCSAGGELGNVRGPGDVARAQRAFAGGDSRLARAILDSAARGRSDMRAADVSPMLITREAALLLALGDTLRATAWIDGSLDGLSSMSANTLKYALENAILVRMMATRAKLAAAANDRAKARQWSEAVAILWAGADPALKPGVDSMQRHSR